MAIVTPNLNVAKPVLIRIHSECLTGDVFGSLKCDCGLQRSLALRQISKSKNGIFIYLRQEGRGIGLHEKILAYRLQELGYDTHEASIKLGHQPDSRDYSWAKAILNYFGVKKIELLTNNPAKFSEMFSDGFDVKKVPLVMHPTTHNAKYFDAKHSKFKHTFGEKDAYHYFGITYKGLQSGTEDIEKILKFLRIKRRHPLLRIHIGISLENKTLDDQKVIYRLKRISKKIAAEKDVFLVIHYNPNSPGQASQDIKKISLLFPNIKHLQINNISVKYLSLLKEAARHFTLIVPFNDSNFGLINNIKIRKVIINNAAFILLDNSGGKGKQESYNSYKQKINKCIGYGLNNIGIAGGFEPGSLQSYFRISKYYKFDFSIDAESRLHSHERLNIAKATKYFSQLLKGK